jgi:hypothetical protein
LVDFNHVTNSLFLSFHHHLFPLLACTWILPFYCSSIVF